MVKNNDKKVVTEDNYKQIVLKRMILVCWLLLIICFIIKIFGGNFFEFIGESKVIDYIVNNKWLLCIIQSIIYISTTFITLLIILENKHKKLSLILSIIMNIEKQIIDLDIIFYYISFIVEFVSLIIIPIMLNRDKILYVIFINALIILFQVISLFTKNIGLISFPYEDIVGFVYMIDYYIMLTISLLYVIKGDFNSMKLGIWFLSKDTTQLEAYKGLLKDKYEKKVAKIDAKIKKINEKK